MTKTGINKSGRHRAYAGFFSYLCTEYSYFESSYTEKMKLESIITDATVKAVKSLYGQDVPENMVQVQKTRQEFEGNLTLVVFPFLKLSRKKPEDTARELGDFLVEHCDLVERYNVVKGFLNLILNPNMWQSVLRAIDADEHYGEKQATEQSPLVMIEYSSPNTNKPLHLGHVRNNLLGWSLSRIMEANGNRVVKTNIVNDRGIHICKSMLAWQKWGEGITPEAAGKKGDHLIGDFYVLFDKHYREEVKALQAQYEAQEGMNAEEAKAKAEQEAPLIKEAHAMLVRWERGDDDVRALWKKMNDWVYAGFDETYKALGVAFDKIYYESSTYLEGKRKVEDGLSKGLFFKKEDGSVWADLTQDGLDQKLLIRSDGTSVYMTQDIGTATMRFNDYPIDKMIYVVGNEQNYHFQVLSILLDRLGFKWGKDLVHFSYGMVNLPNGKMKSREGTVVDADELIAQMTADAYKVGDELGKFGEMTDEEKQNVARVVGLGALKYFILKVDARKNMLFNPAESIDFNGNTGPFIQYTYARIRSIMRKANGEPNLSEGGYTPNDKEVELIQKLSEYGATVADAGQNYNPAGICNYSYELTKLFNSFYHDYSILNAESEEAKAFRLVLARNVAKTIRNAMHLLGIEMPERM